MSHEADWEHLEGSDVEQAGEPHRRIEYLYDASRSIVSENNSPDIPFRYSVNPYRGCAHGCSYCYARPTHEYLGLSAGLDFETKVFVKPEAPQLFRQWLSRKNYRCELVSFSGVTDCYQPAERDFRLTRGCLEVADEFRQPVGIVTKNALVARDLDLLTSLAERKLTHVYLSLTTLDSELARTMEPRTSTPAARLRTVRTLSEAGVPVGVMVAPIIPGLNDSEIPAILEAAAEAGARVARRVMLRLPQTVGPVFLEWLTRTQPNRAAKVEGQVRAMRGGRLNDSTFGDRMRGAGERAANIGRMFDLFCKRLDLSGPMEPLDFNAFRVPGLHQRRLFPDTD